VVVGHEDRYGGFGVLDDELYGGLRLGELHDAPSWQR
jgi:hypothetical protein